jgi:putative acetyltransferase
MAVHTDYRRRGIGSRLVRHSLDALRDRGCPFVIVLGHSDYYPRFGFVPTSTYGIESQWEGVPEAAFTIIVLDEGALFGVKGVVRYRAEFGGVM